ncbi:MAG TPA: hopanoid biosynthesis-associated protein HpnK [Candidatus Sericytochromatia bacterium]
MTNSQAQPLAVPSKREVNSQRRFVIINGDDFGISSGMNRAIIEAHERGVLTSTSLMVTGQAFDEAVALAQAHPKLGVGLHLVLGKGRAVLPPSQIPHLVDEKGNFSNQPNRAGLHYQLNSAARRELRLEIRAQLEKFRDTGLKMSHVDGHLHLHSHPVVMRTLVELADEFNIQVIRLPFEELMPTLGLDRSNLQDKLVWYFVFGGLRLYGERLLKSKGIGFVDRVYGLLQSGQMTESYLVGLIPKIRANLVEIYSHPAIALPGEPKPYGLAEAEFEALLSDQFREAIAKSGFELTNYNNPEAIAACRALSSSGAL